MKTGDPCATWAAQTSHPAVPSAGASIAPVSKRAAAYWWVRETEEWDEYSESTNSDGETVETWKSRSELVNTERSADFLKVDAGGMSVMVMLAKDDSIDGIDPNADSEKELPSRDDDGFSLRDGDRDDTHLVREEYIVDAGQKLLIAGEFAKSGYGIEAMPIDKVSLAATGTFDQRVKDLDTFVKNANIGIWIALAAAGVGMVVLVLGFVRRTTGV